MESVFYRYGFKKRFPVTYLFLELFAKSLENSESDADISEVLLPVLSALGYQPPFKEELLIGILKDLEELQKTKEEKSGGSAKKSGKRSFGSEFLKWYTSLDTDQSLLLVTNFNYDAAYDLYSKVPAFLVDKIIETKLGYEWNKAEKDFEAVVFGMGGSIKGGGDKTFDNKTEEGKKAMEAQLKNLGF